MSTRLAKWLILAGVLLVAAVFVVLAAIAPSDCAGHACPTGPAPLGKHDEPRLDCKGPFQPDDPAIDACTGNP